MKNSSQPRPSSRRTTIGSVGCALIGGYWAISPAHEGRVAVAISMLVCFIKPTDVDPRFGLGVGAFIAAIANTYIVSSLLLDSGAMTLTDMVNGIGMGVIFLTRMQGII